MGMRKDDLILLASQRELRKHSLGHFNEGTDARPLITTGCPSCKTPFGTSDQLMRHIAEAVLPSILEAALERTSIAES
jgi:hypothetical protein